MGVLVALQRGAFLVALPAHVALVGLVRGHRRRLAALVPEQLSRLAELLLAGGALEQVVHAVHMLVVEQVGGLHEALVTQVALEGPDGGVLVSAPVAHQRVLLLKAHLALITVERPLLRVCSLMLPQIGRALEPLATGGAAEGASTLRVAGVVEELGRLFKVQLAQVAFEQVLPRMGVHVAHKVGAVLEAFLAHGALEGPLVAVRALVVGQVRRLAEGLVAGVTLEGLLARVHALVAGELRQMLEALLADGALVRPIPCRGKWQNG